MDNTLDQQEMLSQLNILLPKVMKMFSEAMNEKYGDAHQSLKKKRLEDED